MSLDVERLAEVAAGPRALSVYLRHVWLPSDAEPDPLWMRQNEGRWATSDGTLYTALSPNVVWAEYCRNAATPFVAAADPTGGVGLTLPALQALAETPLPDAVPARALFRLDTTFERVADLTTASARSRLREAGFDEADLYRDDYGACPQISQAGHELGWQAAMVPSAAWRRGDERCVPIFRAGWPPPGTMREIAQAARPTVAIAYLTEYRTGERPAWLDAGRS